MSLDAEALSTALSAIADQDVPASRVDAERARSDGRRMVRRRRAAAGLGGTAAVTLLVSVALVGHSSGGAPPSGGTPATSSAPAPLVTHTADWDPLVAPGTFGWLPDNALNINYSVAPGPGQGSQVLGKGSEVSDGQVGHDPAMIWLAALDPSKPAPKAGPLKDGSNYILIPAPEVNNRPAFWSVDPVKRNPDTGHAGGLFFQSPSGRWASVSGYYLGADPVAETLLHIAQTAHIGDTPVALPVRISGLPATVSVPVAEIDRPTTYKGVAPWSVHLSFGIGSSADLITVEVYPATALPAAGTSFEGQCKVSNGLRICVSTIGATVHATGSTHPLAPVDLTQLPGGSLSGLLNNITSLGMDEAHWTTDVVVVH